MHIVIIMNYDYDMNEDLKFNEGIPISLGITFTLTNSSLSQSVPLPI